MVQGIVRVLSVRLAKMDAEVTQTYVTTQAHRYRTGQPPWTSQLVVPEKVAQEWERCGYVERVTGKS